MGKRPCFLRRSEVRLLDGEVYVFRALPLNSSTVGMVETIMDETATDVARLKAVVSAIEKSLSYDQDPETVEAVMDSGLIPLSLGEDPEANRIHSEVMAALISAAAVGGS